MPKATAGSRKRVVPNALRKVHSVTGVVPLGVYLVFHLWETAAGVHGRERFAERITGAGGSALALVLETVLIVAPLALHAVAGIVIAARARGTDDPGGYASVGSRRLQWLTGALALGFLALHLVDGWMAKIGGADAYGLYEAMRTTVGLPVPFVFYVVGLGAVCFHFGQGLGSAMRTWSLVRDERALRAARVAAGVVAVLLWVVAMNTTAHFARGEALLWGGPSAGQQGEEPAEDAAGGQGTGAGPRESSPAATP